MSGGNEPGRPDFPPADESARAVFLGWERLRLAYNAALGLVVLAFAGPDLPDREFRAFLFRAAVGANLCFCLGPVAEGYLALLGADRRTARVFLFGPGLLLGCLLAFGAILSWKMRGLD
jgi:hypothetical protein